MSHATAAPAHVHEDYTGAKVGMWVFLYTELLLFGGMFLLYSIYRAKYAVGFHEAAKELEVFWGALNTTILLTSSLTMALSIACMHRGSKGPALFYLGITILCAVGFMIIKYIEWGHKFHHKIYPGSDFLAASYSKGEITFFGLYFVMTGLHGLHVLIGMVVLIVMFFVIANKPNKQHHWDVFRNDDLKDHKLALLDKDGKQVWESEPIDNTVKRLNVKFFYFPAKKRIRGEDYVALENAGLYWHLVDVIWIFLFPLFYLIG